jgi:hypothetical protein
VVGERLLDVEQNARAGGVGETRVAGSDPVAGDDGVAIVVGVVDEEEAVFGVARMEGGREQAALAVRRRQRPDVEERPGEDAAVDEDDDRRG